MKRRRGHDKMKALVETALKARSGAGASRTSCWPSRACNRCRPSVLDVGRPGAQPHRHAGPHARRNRSQIEHKLPPDLWKIKIDPNQLENALLNLAVNARDAMPNGGSLLIEGENIDLDKIYADQHEEVAPGRYVLLSVTDTGMGMSKEVRERALEPFFTTKPVGEGTGLGLSMVYGFVKQSNGHINIYSEPGLGTAVRLYLPAVTTPEEEKAVNAENESVPTAIAGEVVLVVEDDAMVRRLAVQLLPRLGYRTIEAGGGPAAPRR